MRFDSEYVAHRAGLNLSKAASPGFSRKNGPATKGEDGKTLPFWHYLDEKGVPIKMAAEVTRINSLAIPPAWTEVWICPDTSGSLQATGLDSKGRKQYRYHADWTRTVAEIKFDAVLHFAEVLPKIRRAVKRDLKLSGMPKDKVVAVIVWLMDRYHIRVGSDEYAQKNSTYGLSTLKEGHMKVLRGEEAEGELDVVFRFTGKSGKRWKRIVEDDEVAKLIIASGEVGGDDEQQDLFRYEDGNGQDWDVKAEHINEYLRRVSGESFTAKDFRTWAATWKTASGLIRYEELATVKERKKAERNVVSEVSIHLGNTPAVCRSSYIHPGILQDWKDGELGWRWKEGERTGKQVRGLKKSEYITLSYLKLRQGH